MGRQLIPDLSVELWTVMASIYIYIVLLKNVEQSYSVMFETCLLPIIIRFL